MKAYLVRGVPASIQQDGWWMDGFESIDTSRPTRVTLRRFWITLAGVAALTLFATLGDPVRSQGGFSDAPAWNSVSACNTPDQTL